MTLIKRKITGNRLRRSGKWFFVYAIMILLVAFTALPLVYLVSTAFKPLHELYVFPPKFLVQQPTL